jgi:hypothetical protein
MGVGAVIPDSLADLQGLEFPDQPGADDKTNDQRRNCGIDCPERNIAEDIKVGKCRVKGV